MATLYTRKHHIPFQVDDDDVELVSAFSWRLTQDGYLITHVNSGNIRLAPNGYGLQDTLALNRLIMHCSDRSKQVDHINHDKLDNRRENLRVCTPRQNSQNRQSLKNTSSRYKGVSFRQDAKGKPWRARIGNTSLGCYATPEEAAQAYNDAAINLYGEYAFINEIDTDAA